MFDKGPDRPDKGGHTKLKYMEYSFLDRRPGLKFKFEERIHGT